MEHAGDVLGQDKMQGILETWKRRGGEDEVQERQVIERQVREPDEVLLANNQEKEETLPEVVLPPGRFDFDLAEFPLFRFYKNRRGEEEKEPIVYTDVIRGKDGQYVEREWKVYPGRLGFGSASTQALLYDLLQLYMEQGFKDKYIRFGTLRSLFQRQGNRNPSKKDYIRMRRDIDILRSYDFHAKRAFWNAEGQTYVNMKWRLFGDIFYPEEKPNSGQVAFPIGVIEVSTVLHQIAHTRGFFEIGFDSQFFHALKPLEQRLALYLSKKFLSQKVHKRFIEDLARAIPIEATRPNDVRNILRKTVNGLQEKGFPLIDGFEIQKARDRGRYIAVFERKGSAKRLPQLVTNKAVESDPSHIELLVEEMIEATGDAGAKRWWKQCVATIGEPAIRRALGQLRETCEINQVDSRGRMLSKICQDLAREQGKVLGKRMREGQQAT